MNKYKVHLVVFRNELGILKIQLILIRKLFYFTIIRISRNGHRVIDNSSNKEINITILRSSLVTKEIHGNIPFIIVQNVIDFNSRQSSHLFYSKNQFFPFKIFPYQYNEKRVQLQFQRHIFHHY